VILNLVAESLSFEGSLGLQLRANAPLSELPLHLFGDGFESTSVRAAQR
jgi:hypothetical protein